MEDEETGGDEVGKKTKEVVVKSFAPTDSDEPLGILAEL